MSECKKVIDEEAELAIILLADFQQDLIDFATNNWAPSHVDMLKRAIECVSKGEKTYP